MVASIGFVAALCGATAAIAAAADEYFEGDGTSYTLGQVSSGNCNFMSAIPTASTNYVALNQEQWNSLGNCGRCIEVSCIDDRCTAKNKTAIVQVLDRCPECKHGALDLSPTVYKEITGLDPHRLTVRWRFVECPNPASVQVCLKEGSNANWMAVQPTNGLVGVKSVTVNGDVTTMLDGAYYYVSTTPNTDLSAVKIAITSVNGDVISDTYSLTAGKCTSTNQQFGSGDTLQTTPDAPAESPTTSAPSTPSPTPLETGSSGPSKDSTGGTGSDSDAGQNAPPDNALQHDVSSLSDDTKDTSSNSPAAPTATTITPATTVPDIPDTTEAPLEVVVPDATEAMKAGVDVTTELLPEVPTPLGGKAKCKVRSRRHRN
uniref:Expansin-like EG45 domain-containing protein n=1 Tax=Hyaloperonospora arabidopsidis (strain Emoy2) TaxID=559515 RepID=M4BM06_HYAAE